MAKTAKNAKKKERVPHFQLVLRRLLKAYEDLKNTVILQVDRVPRTVVKEIIPEGKITGKFEIKKTKDGRLMFNLLATNHMVVATSQTYSSISAVMTGINSIQNNAAKAPIEDQTLKNPETLPFPKWVIYMDNGGEFRFNLYAANGSSVVHSEGYTTKVNCKKGIDSVIKSCANAAIDKTYLEK
jgi:uncharacterized protein YegP (UPF0339 family)